MGKFAIVARSSHAMRMNDYTPDENRYDGRMPYRRCGRWGLRLPAITLGCWWNFGGDTVTDNQRQMIYTSFHRGITHFDLANNYGPPYGTAEINVGKIIKDLPREEIVLSTKAGWDMWPGPYGDRGSRKYLLNSLEQSLKRLDQDYVDIFYMHRFVSDTPMDEMMWALDTATRQGKALYVGISSYDPDQTRDAVKTCQQNHFAPLLIHQQNYSMMNRYLEDELLDTVGQLGLGMICFCPLFQGVLTDKYLNGIPENSRATLADTPLRSEETADNVIAVVRQLNEHAKLRGQSMAQMALSWVLRDERVTSALIGASRPQQILDNVKAVENTNFTDDELAKIDNILAQFELPENLWANVDG